MWNHESYGHHLISIFFVGRIQFLWENMVENYPHFFITCYHVPLVRIFPAIKHSKTSSSAFIGIAIMGLRLIAMKASDRRQLSKHCQSLSGSRSRRWKRKMKDNPKYQELYNIHVVVPFKSRPIQQFCLHCLVSTVYCLLSTLRQMIVNNIQSFWFSRAHFYKIYDNKYKIQMWKYKI